MAAAVTSTAPLEVLWPIEATVSGTFRETFAAPSTAAVVAPDTLFEALRRTANVESVTFLDPAPGRSTAVAFRECVSAVGKLLHASTQSRIRILESPHGGEREGCVSGKLGGVSSGRRPSFSQTHQ